MEKHIGNTMTGTEIVVPILSRQGEFSEDIMVRWIVATCSVALIAALSVGTSEAAKATKKKAEKVEYLRAAGSEPPPAPVKQVKKTKKAE
jgi:hypothetical protein